MKKALPDNPIAFGSDFGTSQREFKFDIQGQLAPKNRNVINGLGRANYGDLIYEGQFVDDKWWGYGRAIYADGRYHEGYFKNDRKNGQGRGIRFDRNEQEKYEEGFW
jgi:hypothetical protein